MGSVSVWDGSNPEGRHTGNGQVGLTILDDGFLEDFGEFRSNVPIESSIRIYINERGMSAEGNGHTLWGEIRSIYLRF